MKKIIVVVILLFIPLKIIAVSADAYIVMDAKNNRVLDGRNISKEHLIASTSKIMTAMIIIENCNLNEEVIVGDEILKSFGSSMYLSVGEKLTIMDLLYGLMLRSGNDAAIVLANHYSGSMERFSKTMNQYAKKIGMSNTNFINSSGLENETGIGNTSTSYDMALLMSYAIKNPIFMQIVGTKYYKFKSDIKTYNLKNKNKLLFTDKRVIGGKTGYTKKARRTLVTTAKVGDKQIIIVTLDDGNDFNDHLSLYNRFFGNYQIVNVCDGIKTIDDPLNLYDGYTFTYNEDCNILLSKKEQDDLIIKPILFNAAKKGVGDLVGVINFELNDKLIYQRPIKLGLKKDIWYYLRMWFNG